MTHRNGSMEHYYQEEDEGRHYRAEEEHTSCTLCGGALEKRRRPLLLKDLLLAFAPLGFGTALLLSLVQRSKEPLPPGDVIIGYFWGTYWLFLGFVRSRRYGKIDRCTTCWAPKDQPEKPYQGFWACYVFSFTFFLAGYLLYIVLRLD